MDQTTKLIDTNLTGFFMALREDDLVRLYHVRWNRARSARYAQQVWAPAPTPTRPEVKVRFTYAGQGPLHDLTPAHAVSAISTLRQFAERGPYTNCMWCHRELDGDVPRAFGMGHHCAEKHLGIRRRTLEVLFRHTPPTGPGTPRTLPAEPPEISPPRRGHLRLVAVNGELVAA